MPCGVMQCHPEAWGYFDRTLDVGCRVWLTMLQERSAPSDDGFECIAMDAWTCIPCKTRLKKEEHMNDILRDKRGPFWGLEGLAWDIPWAVA